MKKVAFALALTAAAGSVSAAGELPNCKYISLGWEYNLATPQILLDHADAYDATPIDGVGLPLRIKRADGTMLQTVCIFTDPAWTRADVAPLVAPLKKLTKHRAFKETLIASVRSPHKRVSWYDDAVWARVANNLGHIAWLAREGGVRGFFIDPEDYKYQDQYRREGDEPPYDEIAAVARKRGRQLFGAMFKEFPDPVILGFWLFSFQNRAAMSRDPQGLLREWGDLWVPFLNGMLDVMPPGARLVDGNEDSYHFEPDMFHYDRNAIRQSERLLAVIAPENRDKYRAQFLPGASIYMDMYTSTSPKGKYYRGPLDGTRVRRLEKDLHAATYASGGYVWFWGEKHPWVNWKPAARQMRTVSRETWNDSLPGLHLAMNAVKNPHELYLDCGADLVRRFGETNRIADSACAIKNFDMWYDGRYRVGTLELDRTVGEGDTSSLCATGVGNGCYCVTFKNLRGGDYYEVAASVLGEGCVTVQWMPEVKHSTDAFDPELNEAHVPIAGTDAAKWRHAHTFVRVPYGAKAGTMMLYVHQAKGQKTHFDNLVFRKVLDFSRTDLDAKRK